MEKIIFIMITILLITNTIFSILCIFSDEIEDWLKSRKKYVKMNKKEIINKLIELNVRTAFLENRVEVLEKQIKKFNKRRNEK